MRTVVNPVDYKLKDPDFNAKSLVLLATPSVLPQVIQESILAYQDKNIQVVVAGVDSMVPNFYRNGVAELWLEETVAINRTVSLEDRDDLNNKPKESDGVNIVVARKNWKNVASSLCVRLNNTSSVELALANTVFSTGNLVTLYFFQPESLGPVANNGITLCELEITLPSGVVPANAETNVVDHWTPLYDYVTEEPLYITDCIGNLAKAVNNKSAAGYLENNDALMSIGSKDTQVFVKLYKKDDPTVYKYEVIAGGGGWGAKANIIALSPEAKLEKGDRIEFYMLKPNDRFPEQLKETAVGPHSFAFEASYEEQSYDNGRDNQETRYQDVFGAGCEEGFRFNGVRHGSAGERVTIALK